MSNNGWWDAFTGSQPDVPKDSNAAQTYLQNHKAEQDRQAEQRRQADEAAKKP
jgi:hypothetical protein